MKIIKSIRIKYFRSILNTTRGNITSLPTNELNIIVGNNDAGKSNYLRALNLFFNNQTDSNTDFNFNNDFSHQRKGIRREESKIEIELIISPPKKQYFKNNGDVIWKKTWKEDSIKPEESITYLDGSKFTSNYKSSYYKWLKKIRFKYVPAIKTQEYFDNLLFNLYDVLQKDTKSLENEFNTQVRLKTMKISNQLSEKLNMESILQFTGSFRDLFNKMKFGSLDSKLMLDQRGDGIKVRHIPIILQNIADEELKEKRKKEPIANTIWGFEEPENNLEFKSAKKLADTFLEYINSIHYQNEDCSIYDEGIQIFLTTHSPIFYTLSKEDSQQIQSFFVNKTNEGQSTIKSINKSTYHSLEKDMELLPLFELSSHWENINNKLNEVKLFDKKIDKYKSRLKDLGDQTKCFYLTEDEDTKSHEAFLKIHNFNLEETEIISYLGVSNIKSASAILVTHLKNKFPDAKFILHRDRDYLSDDEVKKEQENIEKKGIQYFITTGTDIESIFINKDYLSDTFGINKDKVQQFINEATEEHMEDSISRFSTHYFNVNKIRPEDIRKKTKELEKEYDSKKERYRYGKKVFKNIKSKIQSEIKETPKMIQKHESIIFEELLEVSSQIWE